MSSWKRSFQGLDVNAQTPRRKSARISNKQRQNKASEQDNAIEQDKTTENDEHESGRGPESEFIERCSSEPHEGDLGDCLSSPEKDPYEYIAICRPTSDREREKGIGLFESELIIPEEKWTGEERREQEENKCGGKHCICGKPADGYPDHKWLVLRKARLECGHWLRKASYVKPDNFKMYLYNDWEGLGQQEIMENLMNAFHEEHRKIVPSVTDMWIQISALAHWLHFAPANDWIGTDAGGQQGKTCDLIGSAVLTMMECLDAAGELRPRSQFKNIPLVLSLFYGFFHGLQDYGIEDEDLEWLKTMCRYAKAKKITIAGAFGVEKMIEKKTARLRPLKGKRGGDRWDWRVKYESFKAQYHDRSGNLGGDFYDITKFSREERALETFDGKDPLADMSEEDLKADMLVFRPLG